MSESRSFLESHLSQIPAIQLLQKLGFAYLSPEEVAVGRRGKLDHVFLENTLASKLRFLRQQRAALDHQKRGLMQQLLTGRPRVTS